MSKRAILFIGLLSLTAIVTVALPFYAAHAATPLVPCGREGQPMCTFCDSFVLIKNVIDFLMVDILTPVGVLFIVYAGILILTGGYKPGNIAQGKKVMTDTILGIFIIFSAWMITNTILQLFTGDSNVSTHWYSISCNVEEGTTIGGPTPVPTVTPSTGKTPTPTPTPVPVSGNDLFCPNWKGFVKQGGVVTANSWQKCVSYGGGTCKNCASVKFGSLKVVSDFADFLNNKLTPMLQARGVPLPYYNQGMCPTSPHANCAHFNGHAMDISGNHNPAKIKQMCQALIDLKMTPASSEGSSAVHQFIVEGVPSENPGAPCPATCGHRNSDGSWAKCGDGLHLNW